MRLSLLKLLFVSLFVLLSSWSAQAAKVAQVNGTKVLINSEGTVFKSGDQLYLYDTANKKIGLIKVTTVEGNRVQGDVIGGKAVVGSRAFKKTTAGTAATTAAHPQIRGEQVYAGVIGGLSMNTMAITLNSSTTVNMKGSSFSVKGLVDFPLLDSMDFRGYLGLDQLDVQGSPSSSAVKCKCTLKASYLSMAGIARYFISFGKMPFWLGAGGGYQFALSSTSDVLQKVASTNNILFALGLDYRLNNRQYIPIEAMYAYYAPQSGVNLSQMTIKVGYGWAY